MEGQVEVDAGATDPNKEYFENRKKQLEALAAAAAAKNANGKRPASNLDSSNPVEQKRNRSGLIWNDSDKSVPTFDIRSGTISPEEIYSYLVNGKSADSFRWNIGRWVDKEKGIVDKQRFYLQRAYLLPNPPKKWSEGEGKPYALNIPLEKDKSRDKAIISYFEEWKKIVKHVTWERLSEAERKKVWKGFVPDDKFWENPDNYKSPIKNWMDEISLGIKFEYAFAPDGRKRPQKFVLFEMSYGNPPKPISPDQFDENEGIYGTIEQESIYLMHTTYTPKDINGEDLVDPTTGASAKCPIIVVGSTATACLMMHLSALVMKKEGYKPNKKGGLDAMEITANWSNLKGLEGLPSITTEDDQKVVDSIFQEGEKELDVEVL